MFRLNIIPILGAIVLILLGCNSALPDKSTCTFCHQGLEPASASHRLCVDCHGGDPQAEDKEASHRFMYGPKNPSDPKFWEQTCHPDNLWQWLEFAKKKAPEGFSLSKRLWDRRKEQIAKKTGFRMPHNALRHSFCSYHVALQGDAGKTATLLTHRGNVAILYEHYKGNASKAQAEEYFSIVPGS